MKKNFYLFGLTLCITASFLLNSCSKDNDVQVQKTNNLSIDPSVSKQIRDNRPVIKNLSSIPLQPNTLLKDGRAFSSVFFHDAGFNTVNEGYFYIDQKN